MPLPPLPPPSPIIDPSHCAVLWCCAVLYTVLRTLPPFPFTTSRSSNDISISYCLVLFYSVFTSPFYVGSRCGPRSSQSSLPGGESVLELSATWGGDVQMPSYSTCRLRSSEINSPKCAFPNSLAHACSIQIPDAAGFSGATQT